jgi:hypothetical protein
VRYGKLRDRFTRRVPAKHLFINRSGTGLSKVTVQKVFERLRAELGWVARGGHPALRMQLNSLLTTPGCGALHQKVQ